MKHVTAVARVRVRHIIAIRSVDENTVCVWVGGLNGAASYSMKRPFSASPQKFYLPMWERLIGDIPRCNLFPS